MPGNSTLHPSEKRGLQGSLVPDRFWQGAHEETVELRTLSVRRPDLRSVPAETLPFSSAMTPILTKLCLALQDVLAADGLAEGPIDLLKARRQACAVLPFAQRARLRAPSSSIRKRPLITPCARLQRCAANAPLRCSALQVDVEGAELRVLSGISEETWPRIQQVVLETHPVDGRPERLRQMLEAHGFSVIVDACAVGELAGGPETDVMMYAVRRRT